MRRGKRQAARAGFGKGCGSRVLGFGLLAEKPGEIRQVGGILGALGGDDFALMEKEGSGHLSSVAGEMSDATALEDGECPHPPDAGSEEFHEPTFAQSEGAVKVTMRIGNPGDGTVARQVFDFRAFLEHVNEYEAGFLVGGCGFDGLQAAEDLAGECASEVSKENQGDDL